MFSLSFYSWCVWGAGVAIAGLELPMRMTLNSLSSSFQLLMLGL